MTETNKRTLITAAFLLTALIILLNAMPKKNAFLVFISGGTMDLLKLIIVITASAIFVVGPPLVGALGKRPLLGKIGPDLGTFSRLVICLLCNAVIVVLWIVLFYLGFTLENWLATAFAWPIFPLPEAIELPIAVGAYAGACFTLGWLWGN